MSEVIELNEQYYIVATSSRLDDRTRVLKHGDTFAVFDRFGDLAPVGLGELGLYHEGTRFLSRLGLSLGADRPLLLSSTVTDDNARVVVDLTNPDVHVDSHLIIPRGMLHIAREKLLWSGVAYERIRVSNYGSMSVESELRINYDADYVDIFQVRGAHRDRMGRRMPTEVLDGHVVLGYLGLDAVLRQTRIEPTPRPDHLTATELAYHLQLPPRGQTVIEIAVACEASRRPKVRRYDAAADDARVWRENLASHECQVTTSNEQVDAWIRRSQADLHMMLTETDVGAYPYAGVPWFSTPFGRDGIITALQMLWVNPMLARGVLEFLAATQAREVIPEQDAEPGKILHEARTGEMAALGEIPFGRYYGSVDATPLFAMLAGAYVGRTGDRAFAARIWPHVESALEWLDRYGDPDGDGFIEYLKRSPKGLVHQGWKDSGDAVFHADGTPAEGPIALCEVQGYAFAARRAGARLAALLEHHRRAKELELQASRLRARFEDVFWCEDLETYALAIDGHHRPCRVRASNPGHCLATRLATPERARRVARTLLDPASFSGYGIRTIASTEARYNPMSYHNGSVWPHDNALIADGFSRYGLKAEVERIFAGMFDSSLYMELRRLPELFCGFDRQHADGPTLYPVACSPQSWAAGSVFMLLRSCLGLCVQGFGNRVLLRYPALPAFLDEVRLHGLRVGESSVDLLITRHPEDVGVNVLRRTGHVEVVVIK